MILVVLNIISNEQTNIELEIIVNTIVDNWTQIASIY